MRLGNYAVLMVVFLLILGLAMLGVGITGKVFMDENVKDLCESNGDCTGGEICCLFYNKEQGICYSPDMCDSITQLTKSEGVAAQIDDEKAEQKAHSNEIILGIAILLIAIFLLLMHLWDKRLDERIEKVKIKKEEKVREKKGKKR